MAPSSELSSDEDDDDVDGLTTGPDDGGSFRTAIVDFPDDTFEGPPPAAVPFVLAVSSSSELSSSSEELDEDDKGFAATPDDCRSLLMAAVDFECDFFFGNATPFAAVAETLELVTVSSSELSTEDDDDVLAAVNATAEELVFFLVAAVDTFFSFFEGLPPAAVLFNLDAASSSELSSDEEEDDDCFTTVNSFLTAAVDVVVGFFVSCLAPFVSTAVGPFNFVAASSSELSSDEEGDDEDDCFTAVVELISFLTAMAADVAGSFVVGKLTPFASVAAATFNLVAALSAELSEDEEDDDRLTVADSFLTATEAEVAGAFFDGGFEP